MSRFVPPDADPPDFGLWCVGSPTPAVRELEKACKREGVDFVLIPTVRMKSEEGRSMNVLFREDATALYVALHRTPIAVVQSQKNIFVRTHPEPPLKTRKAVTLERFCAYKAFYASLMGAPPAELFRSFTAWTQEVVCENSADPRCLPLQIFSEKTESDLTDTDGRDEFRRRYWRNRNWIDDAKAKWGAARPRERHGREPQTVGGHLLEDGFHWDVSKAAGVVSGTDSVWRFKRGYVNIYADGCFREGSGAKLVWSPSDSEYEDERERPQTR